MTRKASKSRKRSTDTDALLSGQARVSHAPSLHIQKPGDTDELVLRDYFGSGEQALFNQLDYLENCTHAFIEREPEHELVSGKRPANQVPPALELLGDIKLVRIHIKKRRPRHIIWSTFMDIGRLEATINYAPGFWIGQQSAAARKLGGDTTYSNRYEKIEEDAIKLAKPIWRTKAGTWRKKIPLKKDVLDQIKKFLLARHREGIYSYTYKREQKRIQFPADDTLWRFIKDQAPPGAYLSGKGRSKQN